MTKKIAIMIDGGYLRAQARMSGLTYKPNLIEQFGLACAVVPEEIYRILYYDCGSYTGTVTLPVSKKKHSFMGNDHWLIDLSKKDLFAVRRGELKFRGYVLKSGAATPPTAHSRAWCRGVA